jgi:hypothetical protein
MKTNIIVVDNFYNNADNVRNYILTQEFSVKGNYPGFRTKSYATDDLKEYFEKFINNNISWFDTSPETYNGCFQYTTKDMDSWIHRDVTDWAGIIYLTPNAPVKSGTAFFKHIETGLEEIDDTDITNKQKMDKDSNDMSKWEIVDNVANKYNRLVLFRGTRSHRSMEYFGNNLEDGRLFQLFFFNEEKPFVKLIQNPEPVSIKKPKVTILMFTTSRYEYLIPMMESFHNNIKFDGLDVHKILIDDYPLRRDNDILNSLVEKYNIDQLILNEENLGYSLSWKKAWSIIPSDTEYIWHQEDDFVFKKSIKVNDMIELMESSPIPLTQLVLKRQTWFEHNDFIDLIEKGTVGKEVSFDNNTIIIHQRYFNCNPCIYPKWIVDEEYDHNPQESVIVDKLKQKYPNHYCAILGSKSDEPYITHIGDYTQGKKVLEGEPGWNWLKDYDPSKQYDSKKFLTEI